MAKYAVEVIETLVKTVVVEAANADAAETLVWDAYNEGRIFLDSECHMDTVVYVDDYNEWSHAYCDILEV